MPSPRRRALPHLDPEALRTRLEVGMIKRLHARLGPEWRADPPSYERASAALEVDAWSASLPADPRVRRLADEARRVLAVERDVEVHPTGEGYAAAHHADGGPLILSVHWRAFAHADDGVLVAVIGHELGHHLVHGNRNPDGPDPLYVYASLRGERRGEIRETAAAYSRAAELTADRFALLACQDLDAVLRLFAALSDDTSASEDPEVYLAACRARAERLLAIERRAQGDSHPEHAVRAFAAWLFWQSDTYRRLTGQGAGTRSLLDIDMLLARLVGPSEEAMDRFDEPTWMDGVGEAIYEGSAAVGKAMGEQAARLRAAIRGAARPERPPVEEGDDAEGEVDLGEDDLEARFAALERSADRADEA